MLAGLITYRNSLSIPFVWDDETAIVTNQSIRSLWPPTVPLAPPPDTPVAGRPIANLSFAATNAWSGATAAAFHAWNLAFHILCGLLLFGIVRRTLMASPHLRGSPLRTAIDGTALAAALLWLLHPLASEPVDYATQRTESLMGMFLLLTLYAAIRGSASRRRGRWDVAAWVSCACGMASKESMMVAPLVVLLYERGFQAGSFGAALRTRSRLYFGLAATALLPVALIWQGHRSTAGFSSGTSSGTYFLNQMQMITVYLRLVVWPRALVLDYGLPVALSLRTVAPDAALILGLVATTLVALRRWPMSGCLGAMVFLTLAPTSSFVPIATEVGAERRMYVPLMAISVLAVVAGRSLLHKLSDAVPSQAAVIIRAGPALGAAVLVAFAVRTFTRNREFADPVVLWRTVVERRPQGRARLGLGTALIAAGRRAEGVAELQAAAADYEEARPSFALELLVDGRTDEAIAELEQYVRSRPLHPTRIPARLVLGEALASKGRLNDAMAEYDQILQQAPHHSAARAHLADTLFSLERYPEAVQQYRLLAADVTESGVEINLGTALEAAGDPTAIEHYQRALQLEPGSAIAHRRLAETYWRSGNLDEAAAHAGQGVGLSPRDADLHNLFGVILASQKRFAEAVDQFRQAVQLNPGDRKAQANLQHALSASSRKP